MDCPQCLTTVPDASLFCLQCGTRLATPERLTPTNGGGTAVHPGAATAAAAADLAGGKRAYAISLRALPDERLRYRVARWLCEVAPAHPLSEVQQGLSQGGFATFLALTPEEAEATRQRIVALGVHPSLLRLQPATNAELDLPPRSKPAERGTGANWATGQRLIAIGIGLGIFFVFGMVMLRLYGP
jgi:hypothetical protein